MLCYQGARELRLGMPEKTKTSGMHGRDPGRERPGSFQTLGGQLPQLTVLYSAGAAFQNALVLKIACRSHVKDFP